MPVCNSQYLPGLQHLIRREYILAFNDDLVQSRHCNCFRIVDNMEVQELTLGLYQVSETTADYLYSVVKDVLRRFDIPLSNCRGT